MRFTFTIEIPDNRGSNENTHIDFFKAALKQMEETLAYANSKEGKRLMAKLKDKAGCSELELIEECWEAADENLGRKSNAVVGAALTASPSTKKSDPFSKVTAKPAPAPAPAPVPVVEEEAEEEEEAPAPTPPVKAAKFPFKKSPAPVAPPVEEEEVEEEILEEAAEEEVEEEISEEYEEVAEEADVEEEEEAPAAPPRPAKFPFKKLPRANPVPEQQELLSDEEDEDDNLEEEVEEEEAASPVPSRPAKAPFKGGGLKRPAKGMTGYAKKGSPFKKMPFKKLPPKG